jgi:hypothetical protein
MRTAGEIRRPGAGRERAGALKKELGLYSRFEKHQGEE